MILTLGFGGGCHWCTEAVFQALRGVSSVEQGWIASVAPDDRFSEAVLVHFDPAVITPAELLEAHLHTHASGSDHSMREKYRSAVYTFDDAQQHDMVQILAEISANSATPVVTRALPFREFRASRDEITNYHARGPERPFSQTHISPKLDSLRQHFPHLVAPSSGS